MRHPLLPPGQAFAQRYARTGFSQRLGSNASVGGLGGPGARSCRLKEKPVRRHCHRDGPLPALVVAEQGGEVGPLRTGRERRRWWGEELLSAAEGVKEDAKG